MKGMSNNNIINLLSNYRDAVGIDYNSVQRPIVYSASQNQNLYLVRDIMMIMGGITSLAIREIAKSKKYTYRENPKKDDIWSEVGKVVVVGVVSIGLWELGKWIWKQYTQHTQYTQYTGDNIIPLKSVK